jgi:hypothetical protein
MMSRMMILLALFLLGQSELATASEKKEIQAHFKDNVVGNYFFLKVDVIKAIGGLTGGTDASNIYQSGNILHRTGVLVTPDPTYFVEEKGRQLVGEGKNHYLTRVYRGTRVHVHDIEVKDQEIQIEFTAKFGNFTLEKLRDLTKFSDLIGLPPQTLRLKFNKGYTLDDAKKTFDLGFALERLDTTTPLLTGMAKEEVIGLIGVPDMYVILDDRSIMTYKTLKLIFVENKLVNAE